MKIEPISFPRVMLCMTACLVFPTTAAAQDAVNVTVAAADPNLIVGETTTVTVYGQIDAAIELQSDQIFSWYIDILNSDGGVAVGYVNFATPLSDNQPAPASGDGTPEGANLLGIYDSFLGQSGAGKGSPIVLAQFDVMALTPGTATFSVAGGSTGLSLSDFVVAKIGTGFFTGGNYAAASVAITVVEPADPGNLDLAVTVTGNQAELSFTPIPGYDHTAQWSPTMQSGTWTNLPGGPHNTGTVLDEITSVTERFYRVLVAPQ